MSQAEVTREQFARLEARVNTIEQEADGEKMLSHAMREVLGKTA